MIAHFMLLALATSSAIENSQDVLMPQDIFEPPEAQKVINDSVVNCGAYAIHLNYESTIDKFLINKISVGSKKANKFEIVLLNNWLSVLRGNSFPRIFCGSDGVDFVFTESFTRDNLPFRSVEIIYKDGKYSLIKQAK